MMQALTIDEIDWLILIVKNQTDFAPESERKLKIKGIDSSPRKKERTGRSGHQ